MRRATTRVWCRVRVGTLAAVAILALAVPCSAVARPPVKLMHLPLGDLTDQTSWTAITPGPAGAMWFVAAGYVGRIATDGTLTRFPYQPAVAGGRGTSITVAADGTVYYLRQYADGVYKLTPDGTLTFLPDPSPTRYTDPDAVGTGPDGTTWFTESNGRRSYVGRIAADGSIATFPVPWKGHEMFSIVEGPDHAMWFSDSTRRIGRITLDGHVTAKRERVPVGALASNGRSMWFTAGNAVGRMRRGRSAQIVRLPHNARTYAPAVMPDGSLWLTLTDDRDENGSSQSHLAHVTRRARITALRFGRSKRPVSPVGLAAGPNGTAWFLDPDRDYVGQVGAS